MTDEGRGERRVRLLQSAGHAEGGDGRQSLSADVLERRRKDFELVGLGVGLGLALQRFGEGDRGATRLGGGRRGERSRVMLFALTHG